MVNSCISGYSAGHVDYNTAGDYRIFSNLIRTLFTVLEG